MSLASLSALFNPGSLPNRADTASAKPAAMMQVMDVLALAQSALALFAIVDPVGVIPLFLLATRDYTLAQSRAAARLAAITVCVVLLLAAYGGQVILDFFGIRLAAFSVAGGLLLLLLALSMVQAHVSPQRQTADEAVEAEEKDAVGVVPLGVPLPRAAPTIEKRLGRTGIHVVTRLMGLIIAAISIEMIASGLGQLFPGLLA